MNTSKIGAPRAPMRTPGKPSRRHVLEVLALGAIATACSAPKPQTASDAITAPTAGSGAQPLVNRAAPAPGAGNDLVRVNLPSRSIQGAEQVDPPSPGLPTAAAAPAPAAQAGGTTAGGAPATAATTPVVVGPPTTASQPPLSTTTLAARASTTSTVFGGPQSLASNAGLLHVANRLSFGLTPALQRQIESQGTNGYIEDQLSKTSPDPSVEGGLGSFRLLGRSPKATYDRLREVGGGKLRKELTHLNVLRAATSNHQLYEMLGQLWMDHFNIHLFDDGQTQHLHVEFQENVIRPNAMGTFIDLLRATAESPAMLTYLNNDESNANSDKGVNENYGRELLELHTLGIDEAGNHIYNEADVRAASLAMSGWSMEFSRQNANYSEFLFRDDYHQREPVSILNGAWTSSGTTGKATGDSLLLFLATHPSTARHVAHKLCVRFVSDAPPAALVDSTAQVFLTNNTAIVPTLRHIFNSPEFAASEGQKLRRPFESMIAVLRALHATIPADPEGRSADRLRRRLAEQDHEPWAWDQPNGYPEQARHWLSADGMVNRWNSASRLALERETRGSDGDSIRVDYNAIRPGAADVGSLITTLGRQFGLGDVPAEVRRTLAAAAGLEESDAAASVDDEQLGSIAGLLFAHPLFQTR